MQAYSEFGLKARGAMLQKKITMTSLAKEMGVSVSYLSEILKGTRSGTEQKEKIAKILEINVKEN
ncbi:helix-turn-helix protein [Oxobacter pfennigii]|uniref:Helix-turn-helix protein n=1 Tax=Oxobacter pfennigii TaxID=36849 RepID=A0A0P8W5Q7_9CLOT|nr:helix-turn-helix transcriptional regulator [Oxobacter pfennigii]KPU43007.1 helix-turn-helix protein [Oxobacter pfennigii]